MRLPTAGARNRRSRRRLIYDAAKLAEVETRLAKLPPLVFAGEARTPEERALAQVAAGKAFLFQGGDCAESFAEFSRQQYSRYFPHDFANGGGVDFRRRELPVVKVGPHGRAIRQAALRRRRNSRRRDLAQLSRRYHQRARFTPSSREPDPETDGIQAYIQSASTLNLLRAFAQGGYADLHRVHRLESRFRRAQPARASATRICQRYGRDAGVYGGVQHHGGNHRRRSARPISTPRTKRCCCPMNKALTHVSR